MHWGDKQCLFVHFSLFFELKSDILFICMDNICATWSHDFKIYCDWLPNTFLFANKPPNMHLSPYFPHFIT